MRDIASDAHFAMKARQRRAVLDELLRQELQGNVLIEFQVLGAIDLAHASAPNERDDAVAVGEKRPGKNAAALSTQ